MFSFVGLFVCLLVILCKKLFGHEIFRRDSSWDTACPFQKLNFRVDLHSCVDPRIVFLLCLFAVCKIKLLFLLFARCQHYNADDFSDEPDFKLVYGTSLTLQTKTYSLTAV